MLQYLLSKYAWIVGLGGIGTGLLAWSVGLPALLRIVASITDILSPLFKTLMEWIVSGLKDIMDSMATILTVALLCYGVHVYEKVGSTIKHNQVVTQLQVCQAENKRLTKSTATTKDPELWQMPPWWPF